MAEALIYSHNIFAPGLEAAAAYEGTGNEPHSGSVSSGGRQRIESIVLSKHHYNVKLKEKKQCCSS